jgi:hypothetical protein
MESSSIDSFIFMSPMHMPGRLEHGIDMHHVDKVMIQFTIWLL